MEPYRKLIVALLIVAFAVVLPAASTSSLIDGPSAQVADSEDSVAGLYTPAVNALFATGEIQTAVDNAAAGSTIYLRAKKYYDNVDVNKNLNIIGRGMGYTIVDGQKLGSVFKIDQGVTALLSDMTIKNGQGNQEFGYSRGGGVDNLGTVILRRCELVGNSADIGGAVWNYPGSMTIDSCNIHNNYATLWGGAITNDASSNLVLKNSQISFNTADQAGGAMLTYYATAAVTNCQFIGNKAPAGGAIWDLGSTMTVDKSTFMGNRAVGTGTGFLYNEQFGHGGAIYASGTDTITNSVFTNNFASDVNGGGAIFVDPAGTLAETGNYFASNSPSNISP